MNDSLTVPTTAKIQQAAEYFTQWTILNPEGGNTPVRAGRRYILKNRTNKHFLYYKKQGTFGGINVGFTDDASPATEAKVVHWEFRNRTGTPIHYDEPVALRCRDGYLLYGHRNIGINLDWSDDPVYQWRIIGGPAGARVSTRDWVCIWNMHTETGEPLIYFKREIGGNIGWPSSKTLLQQGLDWAKQAVQKAVLEYLKAKTGGSGS